MSPAAATCVRRLSICAALPVLGLAIACGPRVAPGATRPEKPGWSQTGIASWYGPRFHGRPTASGEPYNMLGLSAAHRTLPLGSWIRVQESASARWIVLRVNDRGPYVRGRIVDLSYAAAKILGLPEAGTARVRITLLPESHARRIAERQSAILKRRGVTAWGSEEFSQVEAAAAR